MNKKLRSYMAVIGIAFFALSLSFAVPVHMSHAQDEDDCKVTTDGKCDTKDAIATKFENPINVGDIEGFIAKLMEIAIKIGVPVCIFFIIYSGFLFVSSRGNEEQLTKAKKTFLYTVIGVAILLGAWAIAKAIQGTVNQLAYSIINNIS